MFLDDNLWIPNNTYLLSVSAVGNWFVVIIFKYNVTKLTIGYIFNNMPLNRELACPLILLPIIYTFIIIYRPHHLGHPTELGTSIHLHKVVRNKNSKIRKIEQKMEKEEGGT